MTAIFRSLTPAALLLLSAPLTSCSEPAATLQCPKAQQGTSASVLRETPAGIAQAGEHLGRGSENEIGEEVAAIRAQHSGASQGAIVTIW